MFPASNGVRLEDIKDSSGCETLILRLISLFRFLGSWCAGSLDGAVSGQRIGASTFAKRTAMGVLRLGARDSESVLIGSMFFCLWGSTI